VIHSPVARLLEEVIGVIIGARKFKGIVQLVTLIDF
jgi:hypothetical protein